MAGFVDLHCHFVAGIDDGARTVAESEEMLRALAAIGFETVVATPHMRPGMFDNDRDAILAAYSHTQGELQGAKGLPTIDVSSEHYFDDIVYRRILAGEGVPYPGGRAVLLEFYEIDFPLAIDRMLAEASERGLLPVIAHPERYRCLWKSPEVLERLVDGGSVALLDTAALAGKYGARPMACAHELLQRDLYDAACSDAHRTADVQMVARGIDVLGSEYGSDVVENLLSSGPRRILAGRFG